MESLPRSAAAWYAASAAATATLAVCFVRTTGSDSPRESAASDEPAQQQPLPTQRQVCGRLAGPAGPTRQSAGPNWVKRRRRHRSKPKLLAAHPGHASDRAPHEQVSRSQTKCILSRVSTGQSADSQRHEQVSPGQNETTERVANHVDDCKGIQCEEVVRDETEATECANQSADTPRTERKKKMQAAFASLNSQMEAEVEADPVGSFENDGASIDVEQPGHQALHATELSEDEAVQTILQSRAMRNSRGVSPVCELRQLMRSRSASRSPNQERSVAIPAEIPVVQSDQPRKSLDREVDPHDAAVIGGKLRTKPSGAKPLSLSRPAVVPNNHLQRRSGQIMAEILQAETLLARFRPSGQVELQIREAQQLNDRLRSLRHELQLGNHGVSPRQTKSLQEGVIKSLRVIFVGIRQLLQTAAAGQAEVAEAAGEDHEVPHDADPASPMKDGHRATPPPASPQLGPQFDFLGSALKAELKCALKAPMCQSEKNCEGATADFLAATNLSPVQKTLHDGCPSSPQSVRPRSPALRTSPGVVRSIELDPSSPEYEPENSQTTGKLSPPEGFAHGLVLPPVYDSPARVRGKDMNNIPVSAANATQMGVSPPSLTPPPTWNPATRQAEAEGPESVSQLDELLKVRLAQKMPSPSLGCTGEVICCRNSEENCTSSTASMSSRPASASERIALGKISCNSSGPRSNSRLSDQEVESLHTNSDTQSSCKTIESSAYSKQKISAEVSVESLREMFGSANVSSRSSTTEDGASDDNDAVVDDGQRISSPSCLCERPIRSPGIVRNPATPGGWSALLTAIENVDRSALRARQRTPPERRKKQLLRRSVNPLQDALAASLAKINRVTRSESESDTSSRCSPSMTGSGKKLETRRALRSDWSSSDNSSGVTPSPVIVVSPGKTHLAV